MEINVRLLTHKSLAHVFRPFCKKKKNPFASFVEILRLLCRHIRIPLTVAFTNAAVPKRHAAATHFGSLIE